MRAVVYPGLLILTIGCGQRPQFVDACHQLWQAEMRITAGDTLAGLATYDSAFAMLPWRAWELCHAAELALALNDTVRAVGYVAQVRSVGRQDVLDLNAALAEWIATRNDKYTLQRLDQADSVWRQHSDSIWIRALNEMYQLDQSDRGGGATMLRNDSINLEHLIALTEERGYPTAIKAGAASAIAHLLLWHHRGRWRTCPRVKRYAAMMQEAMVAEELEPATLCMFEDHAAVLAGEPMPYGALLTYHRDFLDEVIFGPEALMDERRKAVGLPPFRVQVEEDGIDPARIRFAQQ